MSRIPNEKIEDIDIDIDELMNPQKCGCLLPLADPHLLHPRIPIFISLDPSLYHQPSITYHQQMYQLRSRCKQNRPCFRVFFGRPDVFKTFALGGILDLQMFIGLQDPYLDRILTY